jgi:hypothetical protein
MVEGATLRSAMMASIDATRDDRQFSCDAWTWWQARRLRYNVTLAVGGCTAYAVAIADNYTFGHPVWRDVPGALGMTIFLGAVYLVVMGVANVFYLLGPAIEGWVKPADIARYRKSAYAMGRWGSLVVPLTFPLVQFALLISKA